MILHTKKFSRPLSHRDSIGCQAMYLTAEIAWAMSLKGKELIKAWNSWRVTSTGLPGKQMLGPRWHTLMPWGKPQ